MSMKVRWDRFIVTAKGMKRHLRRRICGSLLQNEGLVEWYTKKSSFNKAIGNLKFHFNIMKKYHIVCAFKGNLNSFNTSMLTNARAAIAWMNSFHFRCTKYVRRWLMCFEKSLRTVICNSPSVVRSVSISSRRDGISPSASPTSKTTVLFTSSAIKPWR